MADTPPQYADDDLLNVQLAARERSSREDAAIRGRMQSHAAARALGLPVPSEPDPEPIELITAEDLYLRTADATAVPEGWEPEPVWEPEPTAAAPPGELEIEVVAPFEAPVEVEAALPVAAVDPGPAVAAAPEPVPPVQVPRGGPAAVTTGVLAAAAAQKPKADRPLLELRPTVLATEIDRIGDQLVVMTDRIELRDRNGGLRRQLAHSDIEDITVERRLTSAVLHVKSRTATDMVVKGLRPDLADEAQAAILALLPDVPVINGIEERALMHSLLALHRAGVLNDDEMANKTAYVAKMAGH